MAGVWIPFKIRKLDVNDKVTSFDCGDNDLNDFILNESYLYRNELLAVTYVIEDKTEFNRFKKRFKNSKRLKSYPAVKLCRLAVDESVRHLHLGTKLLNFIKGYFAIDNKTGCRFITVDAYINTIPFYLKNNFLELTTHDKEASHTRLLYYDLKMMLQE